jgi:murein hydrolase activator
VILVAAIASAALLLAATDSGDRLKAIEQEIRKTEKQAKSIESETGSILGEMERLDRSISERQERLRELSADVRAAEARKQEAEREVARLDSDLPRLRSSFIARARSLYRVMRRGVAPVVFQAPREFGDTLRYQRSLEAVLAHDRALVAELRRNRDAAESARERASADAAALASERAEREQEVGRLRTERADKQRLLASLRGESEKQERLLTELKSAAENLRRLIEKEEASRATPFEPSTAQGGKMISPLRVPATAVATARNGVEIRVASGTPIVAVKAGRVVFAGWFAGYGKMVILDHGGHLYSVYGYAADVRVEPGRIVAAGDEIAVVGATGPAAAPSLYFEIRERGAPRDPGRYIPALARK